MALSAGVPPVEIVHSLTRPRVVVTPFRVRDVSPGVAVVTSWRPVTEYTSPMSYLFLLVFQAGFFQAGFGAPLARIAVGMPFGPAMSLAGMACVTGLPVRLASVFAAFRPLGLYEKCFEPTRGIRTAPRPATPSRGTPLSSWRSGLARAAVHPFSDVALRPPSLLERQG